MKWVVLIVLLLASSTHAWDGRFPCVSEKLDIGACEPVIGARMTRQPDGSWKTETIRRKYKGWSNWDRVFASNWVLWAFAGDVGTTAYFSMAKRCEGKVREANPIFFGAEDGALIGALIGTKLIFWGITWLAGDSFGGIYRKRGWIAGSVVNASVTTWNTALIAEKCG